VTDVSSRCTPSTDRPRRARRQPRDLPVTPIVPTFTDLTLRRIDRRLAAPNPEQGGALLRPVNARAVTHFEWDRHAATTEVSYVPSEHLVRRVVELESSLDLRLVGVVHSHPNGLNRLSGPDLQVTAHLLQQNPHLGWVCMPVVTQIVDDRPLGDHEVRLPHGRMSCFVARLDADGELRLSRPAAVRVLPVGRTCRRITDQLGWRQVGAKPVSVDGVDLLGCCFDPGPGAPQVWVLLSHDFPLAAPLVALDLGDGLTPLPLPVPASTTIATGVGALIAALELLDLAPTTDEPTGSEPTETGTARPDPTPTHQEST
jgi:proteasome lid subunit RPN8/RPN11